MPALPHFRHGELLLAPIDAVELGKWERGETERGKLPRAFRGLRHNAIPKLTGWSMTVPGFLFGFLRLLCLLFIGLLPTLLKLRDPESSISWSATNTLTFFLALSLIYNHYYDKIEKRKKSTALSKQLRQKLALEIGGITGELSKMLKLRNKELLPGLETATSKVLACIRNAARIHLGDYEGAHLEATLLLFDDPKCETIRVANRTTSSRPTGKVKPSNEVMAYYVAKSRKHRIIDDFLHDHHPFPKKAWTGDAPSYRSILMIPLLDLSTGAPDTCVGVVTIDSTRPYHFWPGDGQDLVVELRPFLFLLALFVNLTKPNRLSCAYS